MPVQFGRDNAGCFARWGEEGKAYYYDCGNADAKADAEALAARQGAAIEANATQATEITASHDIAVDQTPDEPTLPQHIKIRINDPAHFSSYKTVPYRRTEAGKQDTETDGVQVSFGIWKTTGAETAQVYLFDREKGWDDAKVESWFAARPHITRPVSAPTIATQAVADTICDLPITLSEADQDFRKFKVHIIREGWGNNRRLGPDGRHYQDYFPKSFLQQFVPLLESSAVQSVHIEKTDTPTNRLSPLAEETIAELRAHGHPDTIINLIHQYGFTGNTVGFLRDVNFAENAVVDEAGTPRAVDEAVFEFGDCQAATDTRRLVKSAWNKGLKRALGLSVNYRANALFGEVDGRPAFIYETPTHHTSTELVPNPAAGGGFVAVLQSMNEDIMRTKDGTGSIPAQPEPKKDAAATQSDQKQSAASVATQGAASVGKQDDAIKAELEATKAALAATKNELAAVQSTNDAVAQLSAQFAAYKQEQAAKEAAKVAKEKSKHTLEAMVTQSELDDDSKKVLLGSVADGSISTEPIMKIAIETAVKARQFAIAATQAQQPTMGFPGMNTGAQISMGKSPSDIACIQSKLYWDLPLTQAEQDLQKQYKIEGFLGVRDEYVTLTNDSRTRFHDLDMEYFKQMSGAFAQSTSMTTDTYQDFLKNVLSQRVQLHWSGVNKDHLKVVEIGDSFSDTRPEEEYLIGSMDDIDEVGEDGNYTEVNAPFSDKVTSTAKKHGNILSFSEEMILNNRGNEIKQISDKFVGAMNRTLARQIWDIFMNYSDAFNDKNVGTSATGGVLYASTLGNYIDGNISEIDNVRSLVDAMLESTDIAPSGETGDEMSLTPYLAICNVKNKGTAQKILNGEYELTSSNVAKALSLGFTADRVIGIHPNFMRGKPTALILIPDPREFAAVELRYFMGKSAPDLIYEGNQQPQYGYAFASDRVLLKLKMRWRVTLKRKKAPFALYPSA